MKMLILATATSALLLFSACGNSNGKSGTAADTSKQVIPPPSDNSQSTNPSLADTAFAKKDSSNKKDSSHRH